MLTALAKRLSRLIQAPDRISRTLPEQTAELDAGVSAHGEEAISAASNSYRPRSFDGMEMPLAPPDVAAQEDDPAITARNVEEALPIPNHPAPCDNGWLIEPVHEKQLPSRAGLPRGCADEDPECLNPDGAERPSVYSKSIRKLVAQSECSVRLRNAIEGASVLPIETIGEYVTSPEEALLAIQKSVRNLGRKSVRELDALINEAVLNAEFDENEKRASDVEKSQKIAAKEAATMLFNQLRFPDEIIERNASVRLKNILHLKFGSNSITFSEFLIRYKKIVESMLSERNCGNTTIQELDHLASSVVASQLTIFGLDATISTTIRSLLEDEEVSVDRIQEVLKLADMDLSVAKDQEFAPQSGGTPQEIILLTLANLSERERDILQRRYALSGGGPETLQEISESYGVTRERIRQLEVVARRKISNKKIVKTLVAALEAQNTIEKLFTDRKIVTAVQVSSVSKLLTPAERLAIDICYGGVKEFLERESVRTEAGWVLEQYLLDLPAEPEDLAGSPRQRIIEAIVNDALPVLVSKIARALSDLTLDTVRSELISSFDAEIDGDRVLNAPRLPSHIRYILILRQAGHALHCKEIRALNHQIFGKDESIAQVGGVLGRMDEALIVARGTYDLYENLSLDLDDLREIRDTAFDYICERREFVSVKVLYTELFQGSTVTYGPDFDYYMLLGILQDDGRFDVRRGLMIGLANFGGEQSFVGLREEILAVLAEAGHALSLEEIAEALEGRRDTFVTSISTSLDSAPEAVSVGRGHYDLTTRVFGDFQHQERVRDCCCIALYGGPKSALALAEAIAPLVGEYHARPLKSFLAGRCSFEVKGDIIYLRGMPEGVRLYIQCRENALKRSDKNPDFVSTLKRILHEQSVPDYTGIDPALFASEETGEEEDGGDAILDMLLGDFGV